jgi:acetyltransferase-like isoleucine patch superfamily enzyme
MNPKIKQLYLLYKKCIQSDTSFLIMAIKYVYYRTKGKKILAHQKTIIKGLRNITTNGLLNIGIDYKGFMHSRDRTYINIKGKLNVMGRFTIGRGCRFDIQEGATVELGNNSYINPFSKVIISSGLKIGNDCSISWDCQLLDNDFHNIAYDGKISKTDTSATIIIGNNVWIGSGVSIYRGTIIANGCCIAANSSVRGEFLEENVLIAGIPAKVIKKNISWQ